MIDYQDAIRDILVADNGAGGVATLLTAIYTRRELGNAGLKRENSAASGAFSLVNDIWTLQPTCVVTQRSLVPNGQISDVGEQISSGSIVCELFFYDATSFTTITQARTRAYTLLHMKTIAGIGVVRFINEVERFEESLKDAPTLKDDYLINTLL